MQAHKVSEEEGMRNFERWMILMTIMTKSLNSDAWGLLGAVPLL